MGDETTLPPCPMYGDTRPAVQTRWIVGDNRVVERLRGIAAEMRNIGASTMTPRELFAYWASEVDKAADLAEFMCGVKTGGEEDVYVDGAYAERIKPRLVEGTPTEDIRRWSVLAHSVMEVTGPLPFGMDGSVVLWLHEISLTQLLDMCDAVDEKFSEIEQASTLGSEREKALEKLMRICDNCTFFGPQVDNGREIECEDDGACHKNPPTILSIGEDGDFAALFPPVNREDWCGGWKEAER